MKKLQNILKLEIVYHIKVILSWIQYGKYLFYSRIQWAKRYVCTGIKTDEEFNKNVIKRIIINNSARQEK